MNVLLTSIGRRVSLARAFRRELAARTPRGRVLGTDISASSAGFVDADAGFIVPRSSAPEYVPHLLELVRREQVSVLVPLIDGELEVLSRERERFLREGCHVIVSDPEQVALTRDKARSAALFRELGFAAPRVFGAADLSAPDALPYPVFLKPSDGSSSIGAVRVETPEELRFHMERTTSPVVQSFEAGEEFSIDVFCDLRGSVRCVVPRRRLETRAGEISKGLTVKDRALMASAAGLVTRMGGCRGCITLQCFRRGGEHVFFEANLRFGGGFPLTYAAGGNYPGWILRMVGGEEVPAFDGWRDALLMLRYDDAVFVERWTG